VLAECVSPLEGLSEPLRDLMDNVNGIPILHEDVNSDDEEQNFADAVAYLEI
jgi:hypothetical protein